jgi:hypothetical protein
MSGFVRQQKGCVVLGRSANPSDVQVLSDSVPAIGRSLQHARAEAGLSLPDAALRIGVASSELEALESGTVGRMQDRIETLRALRLYADSLGLPGDAFVLTVLDLWPSLDLPSRNGDTGLVPVVSVTSAPAGGHSPSGDYGSAFPSDRTGVSDSTITGMIESVTSPANDTRQVPIYETGQVAAIRQTVPKYLKVLVSLVAILVVVASVGLGLNKQVSNWIHSAQTETNHLIKKVKSDTGINTHSHKPGTKAKHTAAVAPIPKVTVAIDPSGQGGTLTVAAPTFAVQVVTLKNPSWVQVTNSGSQVPVFSQVIAAGQTQSFVVTQSTTIETGSGAAHFLILSGLRIISYYIPTKAPFTMTFNTSGAPPAG